MTPMTLSCISHVKRTLDGTGKRPPPPPQAVFFTFAIDRSGSMRSYGSSVAEQTFQLIGEQQDSALKTGIPTYMTLTTFDDISEEKMSQVKLGSPISQDSEPTMSNLRKWLTPRNCTRLIDTAIECVDDLVASKKNYIKKMSTEIRELINDDSVKMIFALFTDGSDNATDHINEDLNKKISDYQNQNGVAIFMAANQDAINTGGDFGFSPERSLSVGNCSRTASSALRHTTQLITSAGSGERDVSYTMAMREESQEATYLDNNNPVNVCGVPTRL